MTDEIVRLAEFSDEDEIMRLLTVMHAEGGIMPLDEIEAKKTFHLAFNRQGGILGVIGEPGNIKAMIFLLISRFWYTKEHHLEELFNFVRPDVRKTPQNYAARLIDFARSCSDEMTKLAGKPIPLTIGVLTNQRMEGKVRLYRRSLGFPAGAWFVHGAKWQNEEPNEDFWREPFPKRGKAGGRELRHLKTVGGRDG